jgi:predicted O-methyltransferase YrrM
MTLRLDELLTQYGLDSDVTDLGTDKRTIHSYIEFLYQPYFDTFGPPQSLLEIGVFRGASLVLWKLAFPEAKILGADINMEPTLNPLAMTFYQNRDIELIFGDAYLDEFWFEIKSQFELIIDDGPHTLDSQLEILNRIQFLNENGTLIIEDIAHGWSTLQALRRKADETAHGKFAFLDLAWKKGRYDDLVLIVSNNPMVIEWVTDSNSKILSFMTRYRVSYTVYQCLRVFRAAHYKVGRRLRKLLSSNYFMDR